MFDPGVVFFFLNFAELFKAKKNKQIKLKCFDMYSVGS